MTSPFVPFDPEQEPSQEESERLAALWSYGVLDSPPEACFDDVAEIAAKNCGTPYALISFLDRDRQWFKSRIGFSDLQEMPREHAFCHFCIQNDGDILEIPDPLRHDLFKDNPIAQGTSGIRFYGGAPIRVKEGHLLGTVCVLDHRSRTLSLEQKQILKILAGHVSKLLEILYPGKEMEEDRDE